MNAQNLPTPAGIVADPTMDRLLAEDRGRKANAHEPPFRVIVVDANGRPTGVELTAQMGQLNLGDMVQQHQIAQMQQLIADLRRDIAGNEQAVRYFKQLLESEKQQRQHADAEHNMQVTALEEALVSARHEKHAWQVFAAQLCGALRERNATLSKLARLFEEVFRKHPNTQFTRGRILGALSRVLRAAYKGQVILDRPGFGPETDTLSVHDVRRLEALSLLPLFTPDGMSSNQYQGPWPHQDRAE